MTNKLTQDQIDDHKAMLEKTLSKKFSDNPLLSQFSQCYLKSLPAKSLQSETVANLHNFIEDQFNQFIRVIESSEKKELTISPITKNKLKISIISPDAFYLIFTLENVFKQFNMVITKLYHPLLSVYINKKNKVVLIDYPNQESMRYSVCYIECTFDTLTVSIDDLKSEILKRLYAVSSITRDHDAILQKLSAVQSDVAKVPTPKIDFHTEWVEVLDWLSSDNFSFFGYAEFTIQETSKRTQISVNKSQQLGILAKDYITYSESELLEVTKDQVKLRANYRSPYVIDSLRFKSPVKRFENLMRVSLKIPAGKNKWINYNFIGLLKRSSLLAKNTETPIIKLKIKKIIENKRFWKGSHQYNQTIRLLNDVPKIELFKTPTENLQQIVENLLSITNPNDIAFFTRSKIDKSKLFLLGIIPNNVFSEQTIKKILFYLLENIPHQGYDYLVIPGELYARLHIYFDQPNMPDFHPDLGKIESDVVSLLKSWDERLKEELDKKFSKRKSESLYQSYHNLFPEHHKIRRTPEHTIIDIELFEKSNKTKETEFNLIPFVFKDSLLSGKASLLNIYHYEKIDLFQFIPIFQNLNIYFFDELTTRVGSLTEMIGYIHAFRIKFLDTATYSPDFESFKPRFLDLLKAIFNHKLPNDPLNGLISCTELSWKHIFILQAYRNYLIQLKPNYTKDKIDKTLLKHQLPTEYLINYFFEKFTFTDSHKASSSHINQCDVREKQFFDSLSNVSDIDEDFIFKWLFSLIKHTLRTNYFQHELESSQLLSLKIDGNAIITTQEKTFREIFVFHPEMEGIHIRFGMVSRGGIRWSSRLNDFRSEVLGLASTQRVKNVVIVPNGSKGGFVIKKSLADSDPLEESKKQYQLFIKGLLSVTDNTSPESGIIKPNKVLCYDADDPYLVVAADKGTATFSDFANDISHDHQFWLDDAFASGGSNGFNHKDLGITAKGAWECVKLHFKEQNKDIDKEPFTCIGIGDMSGDVFGNGMLLSKQTRLIAAFNHIHIFIDPDPKPLQSWTERQRLFNLEKSTWKDYNPTLISKGGGVYDRSAKNIVISSEAQTMLGLKSNSLNGSELINAILKCNVELLWFAGIGTYIKGHDQSHAFVSDLANDSVRINANECQATIIGEGANLAITQHARFYLSENAVKLNTDFIDNSAGVNISDYEVNLKIFLQHLLSKKLLKTEKQRSKLLKKLADNVIDLVLHNNQLQHQLISMEEIRSQKTIFPYQTLINQLIQNGIINPKTDAIPKPSEFDELDKKKLPLPRPLLAQLQSLVKLDVSENLLRSDFLTHPIYETLYVSYFPHHISKTYYEELFNHPLRKEITATALTNYCINNAGILSINFMKEVSGKPIDVIANAYYCLNQLFSCDVKREQILSEKKSYAQKYHDLIAIEGYLNYMVLDALLLKEPMFSLENFDLIYQTHELFLANNATMLDNSPSMLYLSARNFIPFYSIYQSISKSQQEHLFQSINTIYTYFDFEQLLTMLDSTTLVSTWEVEQHKLLHQILSQQKLAIIKHCVTQCHESQGVTEEFIKSLYNSNLTSYKQDMSSLIGVDSISLSALSVVVNKLTLI
jgi:glutamate dehydrogenase